MIIKEIHRDRLVEKISFISWQHMDTPQRDQLMLELENRVIQNTRKSYANKFIKIQRAIEQTSTDLMMNVVSVRIDCSVYEEVELWS